MTPKHAHLLTSVYFQFDLEERWGMDVQGGIKARTQYCHRIRVSETVLRVKLRDRAVGVASLVHRIQNWVSRSTAHGRRCVWT